jgi:hypothetical protein
MTTHAPERVVEPLQPESTRRTSWAIWIAIGIVVVVAAAVGVWLVLDEGEPTVTFDGTVATYSGPTSFEAGSITFTLDATEYDYSGGVAIAFAPLTDESLTMSDLEALAEQYAATEVPPGIDVGRAKIIFAGSEVIEREVTLNEGMWAVVANTAPSAGNRVHPAAILEVSGS